MLKKIRLLFVLLLLVTICSVALIACQNTNGSGNQTDNAQQGAGFILALHEGIPESFTFVQGEIDYSQIYIDQIATADNSILTSFYAKADLISEEDLIKLKSPGTYSISITYSGVSVDIVVTITPKAVEETYNIIYNAGLGMFSQNSQNLMNANVAVVETLPIPVREGYEFAGWYFNISYTGDKLIAPYALSSDVTVYAKWIDERQFTVTVKSDITQEVIQKYTEVEYGQTLIAPTAPEIDGFAFTGWRGSFTNIVEDTTIWAEYSRIKVTVKFTSEVWSVTIGNPSKVIELNYGETLFDPETLPQKEGYAGEWIDDDTGLAPNYASITKDMNITAKYTINTFVVNFYTPEDHTTNQNYSISFTRTVDYKSTITQIPAVPAKEGYIGVWQEYYNGRLVDADLTQIITANVSVYATYAKRKYDVSFVYENASRTEKIVCEYGDQINGNNYVDFTDPDYNPKYYKVEWYNAQTFAADKKITFPYTVSSAVTFYMKKIELPYTVDFCIPDLDNENNPIDYYTGDKVIYSTTITARSSIVPPTINLRKYELVGWKDATTGLKANFDSVTDFHEYNEDPLLDRAYYAILSVKKFTIDFRNMVIESEGGIDVYTSSPIVAMGSDHFDSNVKYDTIYVVTPTISQIIKPEYPNVQPGDELSDFEFVGWFTTADFTTAKVDFEAGYKIVDNVTFYAKWVDKNKGSSELRYELNEDGISYSVCGFDTTGLEKYSTIAEVNIPRSHSEDGGVVGPVTGVSENAFAGTESFKILAIEFTVNMSYIKPNAFASCKYLNEFKVKGGDTLENLVIVDNILYSADMTILYKYSNGKNATSFTIPNTVERIEGGAFAFSKLSEILFPSDSHLKVIGNGAFSAMVNIQAVVLPKSLETIEADAFRDCGFLSSVTIDGETNNLSKVEELAFDSTKWWTDSINNNHKVELGSILISYNDYTVETLDLTGYSAIADGALGGDENTTIHTSTFAITKIIVNENSGLEKIGKYAFSACVNLTEIRLLSNDKIDIDATSFDGISKRARLYASSATYELYKNDANILSHFDPDYVIEA